MDITQIASKPKVVEIVLDAKHIVKKYNEPVTIYSLDKHPLETYMRMVSILDDEGHVTDNKAMIEIVKELILDKDGNTVFADGKTVPLDIAMESINAIVGKLGN